MSNFSVAFVIHADAQITIVGPVINPWTEAILMRHLAKQTRAEVERSNVTPVWLLPFWRLVRGEAQGDYAKAWKELPNHLPKGVECPSIFAAAAIITDHGLA